MVLHGRVCLPGREMKTETHALGIYYLVWVLCTYGSFMCVCAPAPDPDVQCIVHSESGQKSLKTPDFAGRDWLRVAGSLPQSTGLTGISGTPLMCVAIRCQTPPPISSS